MANLSKDTFYSLLTKLPVILLSFVASVFFVRILGAEGKGLYAYIIANVELAALIFGFNLPTATTYFLAKKEIPNQNLAGLVLLISFFCLSTFSLIAFLIYLFNLPGLGFLLPQNYQSPFFLLMLLSIFAFNFSNGLSISILQGKTEFKRINILAISTRILNLLLYASIYFSIQKGIWQPSLQQIFTLVLGVDFLFFVAHLIAIWPVISKKISFKISWSHHGKPFWKYIRWSYLTMLVNFGNKRLDVWMVEHFRNITHLGWYSLASGTTDYLITLLMPIPQVLLPYLTKMKSLDEKRKQFLFYSRINFSMVIILATGLIILLPYILPFLYGQEFSRAILPAQILCCAAIFTAVRNVFSVYNYAQNRVKFNLFGNLVGLIITIILDIYLIPKYGIVGAAIASTAAYFCSCIVVISSVVPHLKINPISALIIQPTDIRFLWNKLKSIIGN